MIGMIPMPPKPCCIYLIDLSASIFRCSWNALTGDDIPTLIPRLTMLSYKFLRVLFIYCILELFRVFWMDISSSWVERHRIDRFRPPSPYITICARFLGHRKSLKLLRVIQLWYPTIQLCKHFTTNQIRETRYVGY